MSMVSNPAPATKLTKQGTYTQTYSPAARIQALEALSTSISIALLTEVAGQINTTNAAVNELKKLANGIVDDMQTLEMVG